MLRWPADRPLRSVFMGTPEFAIPSLDALAANTTLVGVVSQPDKPRGRGLASSASPVARAALARGMPLIRPATLRDPEVLSTLRRWCPDLVVVVAYGKILPRAVLDLPTLAPINVHASLLPRHRGAAPVAAAILAGDATTGITIMLMSEGVDEGGVLFQRAVAIEQDDTTGSLTVRLAAHGASALGDALALLRGPGLVATAQDSTRATYAPRLERAAGSIDWHEPAETIARKVRAFTPWPSASTSYAGRAIKILRAHVAEPTAASGEGRDDTGTASAPGTIVKLGAAIRVATGAGGLELESLQMEGRKPLDAREFAAGARLFVGGRFA